jgi:tetratricopeptide (TPR) repeat protein
MILFLSVNLSGFNAEQMFRKANRFYKGKEYEKALELYLKIEDKGYAGGDLFYNIGNTYYRLNKLGYAILYYERALKMSPRDEDIQFNLKLANAKTVDKLDEIPKIFLTVWWESLITLTNYSGWALLIVVFLVLFLAALSLYFLGRKLIYKKYGFYLSSSLFAILVFLVIVFYSSYQIETKTDYGILTSEMTIVKQAPDSQSGDAFIIHEGIKFTCEDQVGEWTKIKLVDGKIGWIEKSAFQKI